MRPVSLMDENLDDLDLDAHREFERNEGSDLGRRRKSLESDPNSLLDLFDSHEDSYSEDEDSALFEEEEYD